jgi:hypothetical protein
MLEYNQGRERREERLLYDSDDRPALVHRGTYRALLWTHMIRPPQSVSCRARTAVQNIWRTSSRQHFMSLSSTLWDCLNRSGDTVFDSGTDWIWVRLLGCVGNMRSRWTLGRPLGQVTTRGVRWFRAGKRGYRLNFPSPGMSPVLASQYTNSRRPWSGISSFFFWRLSNSILVASLVLLVYDQIMTWGQRTKETL